MGTKFALSYANLYMGEFENNNIACHHSWRNNIIAYKQFIDDLLFIWKGSVKDFHEFTKYLNRNEWGLTFSGETHSEKIYYLDVTLFSEGERILMSYYFKPVDCNSLLDFRSYHHKQWRTNIPFGQFRRLRKNCTKDSDFQTQSNILHKRFDEK